MNFSKKGQNNGLLISYGLKTWNFSRSRMMKWTSQLDSSSELATKMNFVEFRYGQIFQDFRGKKEPKCACHVGDTWHGACMPCG